MKRAVLPAAQLRSWPGGGILGRAFFFFSKHICFIQRPCQCVFVYVFGMMRYYRPFDELTPSLSNMFYTYTHLMVFINTRTGMRFLIRCLVNHALSNAPRTVPKSGIPLEMQPGEHIRPSLLNSCYGCWCRWMFSVSSLHMFCILVVCSNVKLFCLHLSFGKTGEHHPAKPDEVCCL